MQSLLFCAVGIQLSYACWLNAEANANALLSIAGFAKFASGIQRLLGRWIIELYNA